MTDNRRDFRSEFKRLRGRLRDLGGDPYTPARPTLNRLQRELMVRRQRAYRSAYPRQSCRIVGIS